MNSIKLCLSGEVLISRSLWRTVLLATIVLEVCACVRVCVCVFRGRLGSSVASTESCWCEPLVAI